MKAAAVSPTKEKHRLKLLQKYGGAFVRPWQIYTRNGGTGHPALATREKGEKIVKASVERIGDILVELARATMDKRFPY
jgi:creatinine amidohydrolase/Fe(II)-dependent formamide hydrolase-like protein